MRTAQLKHQAEADFLRHRNKVLDVLRYGEMITKAHGLQMTAAGVVWQLCQDAMEIESRCTDKALKFLRSAERAHMPEIVRSWLDIRTMQMSRLVNDYSPDRQVFGIKLHDPIKVQMLEPTDAELERMFIVGSWGQFITRGSNPVLMQKCFRLLAGGAAAEYVCRKWRPGKRPNRQAVYDLRIRCCQWIVEGLLTEYGIVWGLSGFGTER
jgi:hypothetical protein